MAAPRTPRGADKAPHPADARRAEVLANPAGFTASIRHAGRNNTIPADTLERAATWAVGLETAVAQHGGSTRATVYALPRDGGGPEVVNRDVWQALVSAETRTVISRNVAANSARILGK